jgi:hypothetical protein
LPETGVEPREQRDGTPGLDFADLERVINKHKEVL